MLIMEETNFVILKRKDTNILGLGHNKLWAALLLGQQKQQKQQRWETKLINSHFLMTTTTAIANVFIPTFKDNNFLKAF